MKFLIFIFSLFLIYSCTISNIQKQSKSSAKTWELENLLLVKNADSLWHFKTPKGEIIEELGAWASIKMLYPSLDFEYWLVDLSEKGSDWIDGDTANIGEPLGTIAEQNLFFITQNTTGQNFIIYNDQPTHPYKAALSIEDISSTTEALCLINPDKSIFDHKFWEVVHPNIQSLLVVFSDLDSIPKEIAACTKLNRLDWIYSTVKSLSKEIAALQNLQNLNFTSCNFHQVPEILGLLPNIKSLNFIMNPLEKLAPSIGNFKKLEYLNLSYTSSHNGSILSLPNELEDLKKLKHFYFYDVEELPTSLLKDFKKLQEKLPNCTIEY